MSCSSLASRDRSASAAICFRTSRMVASWASSASARCCPSRLSAASADVTNRKAAPMAMVSTVLAGFTASCASEMAIATTTGIAASSATRRGTRRARPASAMNPTTSPGPSDCGQSRPAPQSPSPIRADTTSRGSRARSLSPTAQHADASTSTAADSGRAIPAGRSSTRIPVPTPRMVIAPTGTSQDLMCRFTEPASGLEMACGSPPPCARPCSRAAPSNLDPTFLARRRQSRACLLSRYGRRRSSLPEHPKMTR